MLSFSQTHNLKHEVQHYVGVLMDIADKKQNERKIHRLAFYDALTEVGNRSLFHERLAAGGGAGTAAAQKAGGAVSRYGSVQTGE
ncbi:MAG: GGDEF domain-containing protein [Gammaproteobacteria bacterium]